jgi:hypoxanthine phosphoribosyltransferase
VLRPDFVAFEIPDEFVVGYGLDFQDHFRNLPYLGVLEDSDFEQFKQPVK